MRLQFNLAIASVLLSTLIGSSNANALTIKSFSPEDFSDEVAGISGFTIEDFEDTTLIPGLSVEWTNPQIGPFTTLSSVVNERDAWYTIYNPWDGENFLGSANNPIKFNFSTNPTSVGIGISNYQFLGAKLLVNGAVHGDLATWISRRTTGKNAYLRLDADAGQFIHSIGIDGRPGDFIGFDHIAVGDSNNATAIPTPPGLGALAVMGTLAIRRRLGCCQENKSS